MKKTYSISVDWNGVFIGITLAMLIESVYTANLIAGVCSYLILVILTLYRSVSRLRNIFRKNKFDIRNKI